MRRAVRFKDFFVQLTVVSVFVFILVALYPTDSFFDKEVKAIYSIDVNPGIIVMVDEDETVLHIEGIDAESQELISNIKYRKKKIDEVMTKTINQLIANGYINDQEKNYVVLSKVLLDYKEEPINYALVDLIHQTVWEQIDGEVEVYYYQGTEEVYAAARSRGITPGVALFINQMKSQDTLVSVDEQIENTIVSQQPEKKNIVRELAKNDEIKENVVSDQKVISGTISITVSSTGALDDDGGMGFNLKTPSGNYYGLDLSQMSIQQKNEITNHRNVLVTGRLQLSSNTVQVERYELMPMVAYSQASSSSFKKERKVGVFILNFNGSTNPNANNISTIRSSANTAARWLERVSHNQMTFSVDVFGPVLLSAIPKNSNWDWDNGEEARRYRRELEKVQGDLSHYDHVVMLVPNRTTHGKGEVGGSNVWIGYQVVNSDEWRYIFAHEIGHNLGAWHSASTTHEYGDSSCIMGNKRGPLINAGQFYDMKLFSDYSSTVQDVTSSGTFTVSSMSTSLSDSNPKLLRIPISGGKYIYVSYRNNSGKDSGIDSKYTNGANIHTCCHQYENKDRWFQSTIERTILSSSNKSHTQSGVTITQLSKTSNEVTVEINNGTTAPKTRSLTINSLGASGVSITTDSPQYNGTTNYTKGGITNGTTISISAPQTVGNATFIGWTGTGCSSDSHQQRITMSQDVTCNANYTTPTSQVHSLQVNSTGTNGVSISASGGYEGTTPYTKTASSSTTVTLTAPASSGGVNFASWTGVGCTSNNRSVTVNMSENRICTANYGGQNTWQLSVNSAGASNVSITASPNSNHGGNTSYIRTDISHGAKITLTAPAKVGNTDFAGWSGAGCTNTNLSIVVDMTANRNCTANYRSGTTPPPSNNLPTLSCNVSGSNQINLSWTNVSGVSTYYVWRCNGSSCVPRDNIATTSGTSYAVTNLSPNTAYTFRVFGTGTVTTPDSNYVTCTTGGTTTPPPATKNSTPTGLFCQASGNSISIYWGAVSGAGGYNVWMCDTPGCSAYSNPTSFKTVSPASTTNTTFTSLQANKIYRFQLVAYGGGKNWSDPTQAIQCTAGGTTTPPPTSAPILTCNATSSSQISLSWNHISGASNYYVSRCEQASCIPNLVIGTTTANTVISTALTAGTTYGFSVQARRSTGEIIGGNSNIVRCTTSSEVARSTYTLQVNSTGASNVYIQSTTGHGNRGTPYNTSVTSDANVTLTAPRTSGSATFTNWSGTGCSSTSQTVTINMSENRTCTANYTIQKGQYATPTGLSCSTTSNSVRLSWNGVSGASTYYIYSCWGHSCVPQYQGNSSETSRTFTSLMANTTYRYQIMATGSSLNPSSRSQIQTCTTSANPAPEPATNLTCNTDAPNQIRVNWSPVLGASGYHIEYCEGSNCTPRHQNNGWSQSPAFILNASNDRTYRFRVTPAINQSPGIASQILTCDSGGEDQTIIGTPLLSCRVLSDKQIDLNFVSVSDADATIIYHCEGVGCTPTQQINKGTERRHSFVNLKPNTTYSYSAASVYRGKTYEKATTVTCKTMQIAPPPPQTDCVKSFVDQRDGQIYPIIEFKQGDRTYCLFGKNLNYNLGPNTSACYENSVSNCNKYGRLYTFAAINSACPPGWRVPSDGEWQTLEVRLGIHFDINNIGMRTTGKAGTKLKGWENNEWYGSNTIGFNALPGGRASQDPHYRTWYFYNPDHAYFATSTTDGPNAWYRSLVSTRYGWEHEGIGRYKININQGNSIRCIMHFDY